jgi:L-lactate dehydrogenase complex protein LldG
MTFANHPVMKSVRRALGRTETPASVPVPPPLPDPVVRLVHTDLGLSVLFAAKAKENKIKVTKVSPEELANAVVARAKDLGIASMAYPSSALLESLGVPAALAGAGVRLARWDQTTLDAVYDVDGGLTDAWAAVAETGSLVVTPSPTHGRGLSLVPEYHFVVLDPKVILPDLVDLFAKMTTDIEMNLDVGVHGPGQVEVFLLG